MMHAKSGTNPGTAGRIRTLGLAAVLGAAGLGAVPVARTDARYVTIPAGTGLVGTLTQPISTKDNEVGNVVEARIAEALRVGEDTYLPAGMVLKGRITKSEAGGRVTGRAEITIQFDRLLNDGREYKVQTEPFDVVGKSETKNSAKKAIGGAVAGGILGAILGNTKKGILVGAAAGTGVAVATKGGHIELPEGQRLQVRLTEPVTVYDQ